MISKDNVGIVDRAFRAIWNGAHGTALQALFADGFEFRNLSSLDDVTDLDGLRQRAASLRSTYPCGRLRVQDTMKSGDLVSVWWTFRHDEGCRSGRASRVIQRELLDGTCMFRLQGGRIIEMWELGGQMVGEPLAK